MPGSMNKILLLANKVISRSYWFNNVLFPNCRKFWTQNQNNLELVNLGSTSALHAFDYKGTGITAANWAMAPQTFVGDYQILRNYYSFVKKGATILLPICPFSSLGGGNEFLPDYYYSILNIISIPNASFRKKIQVKQMQDYPLLYYPIVELFYSIGRLFKKHKEICTESELKVDAANRVKNWKKEFSIESFDDDFTLLQKDLYSDSVKALKDIISFCIQRNLKPVLVLPPLSKPMRDLLSESVVEKFITRFLKDANEMNIPTLNHLIDSTFDNEQLFRDSFLLNKKGAKIFTNEILSELKNLS